MHHVSLVVAIAQHGVIGSDGGLPWRLPADLKYFKKVTLGKPVVMGRKTFESIGRPLPGRRNVVISRSRGLAFDGVEVVSSPGAALTLLHDAPEIMIIGGAAIYRAFLPHATRLLVTYIHTTVEGDTHFPALEWSAWTEVSREERAADEKNAYALSFVVLEPANPKITDEPFERS